MRITHSTISYGTYKLECPLTCVYDAIQAGFRYIDCAAVYKNEDQVYRGIQRAIQEGVVDRSEIFITSKVSPKDGGYTKTKAAIHRSISNLRKVDCMILHWPGTSGLKGGDEKNKENRSGSIQALREALQQGLISQIGVSNFDVHHFDGIDVTDITLNQIEVHPLIWDSKLRELVSFCGNHGIVVQAYSCLGGGRLLDGRLYPEFLEMSYFCECTIAQLLLRWTLIKGISVVVKTANSVRMMENLAVVKLSLTVNDTQIIDAMLAKYGRLKFRWDSASVA